MMTSRTLRSLVEREPVRVYLGGVLAALVTALTLYGVLDGNGAVALLGLGTALLGAPAVEGTRARVTPYLGVPVIEATRPEDDQALPADPL